MDRFLLALIVVSLLLHYVYGGSVTLTSNVVRGGMHLACSNERVVFTCSGDGTALRWTSSEFSQPVDYSRFVHSVGEEENRGEFVAILTKVGPPTIASTLTAVATASMNGASIVCEVDEQNSTTSLVIVTDPPSTPQSPQLSVSGYGVGGANVIVEWMYPDDGPVADNYTVSLSMGEPVTTTELMAIIEEVPYDQPLTGSVMATNCIGSSSPSASIEVPCGVPRPPVSGSIEAFTVTEVVYRCDPGFGPGTVMTATCESGNWTPTPPAYLTCTQTTTVMGPLSLSTTKYPIHPFTVILTQSDLHAVEQSLTPTQSPTSDNSEDNSCTSVTMAAAVSATVSFVVAFLLGSATGAVVLYCTVGKQSDSNCRPCPKSPENQYQDPTPGPMYETVSALTQTGRENIELKDNLAYGPVRS